MQNCTLERKSFLKAMALAGLGLIIPGSLKPAFARAKTPGGGPHCDKPLIGDRGYEKRIGDLFAQAPAKLV